MQADMEEAKTKENAKLQSTLQEMQLQFEETKSLLMKEREAAVKASEEAAKAAEASAKAAEASMKAAEQVPVVLELPVVDHEIVTKLTAENEQLKVKALKLLYAFVSLEQFRYISDHFMITFNCIQIYNWLSFFAIVFYDFKL